MLGPLLLRLEHVYSLMLPYIGVFVVRGNTRRCFHGWSVHGQLFIYTTKIDGVVCPPNISEAVAGRLMKLAHRPRIASTMIKLISKPILLPIYLILVKTIQRIVADPKRFSQSEFSPTTADVARTTFRLDRL